MSNIVKVNGSVIEIPAACLPEAIKQYVLDKPVIDYNGMKNFLADQRIDHTPDEEKIFNTLVGVMGYVDFDAMHNQSSRELVYSGLYRHIAEPGLEVRLGQMTER